MGRHRFYIKSFIILYNEVELYIASEDEVTQSIIIIIYAKQNNY